MIEFIKRFFNYEKQIFDKLDVKQKIFILILFLISLWIILRLLIWAVDVNTEEGLIKCQVL